MVDLACPPTAATADQLLHIQDLDHDVANLFCNYKVPWKIQAVICAMGYTSMDDVAERWPTKTLLRERGARDLGLITGEGEGQYQYGYDPESTTRALVRLSSATEDARRRVAQRAELLTATSSTAAADLITKPVRASMEKLYRDKAHRTVPLERQGSDQFLGKAFKQISNGYVPYFSLTEMVPFLPDSEATIQLKSKRRRREDGVITEHDEDEVEEPHTRQQWLRTLEIFKSTLLMAIWANPQHGNLQVEVQDLEDFYGFLDGPDVGSRSPMPSLEVLKRAERAAWRKIS